MSLARFAPLASCFVALAAACGSAPPNTATPGAPSKSATSSLFATAAPKAPGPCESLHGGHPTPVEAGRGDRVVLARDGARTIAYVADEDEAAIHTVDLSTGKELGVTGLSGSPSAIVGLADGRLVAALRDRNEVVVLEPGETAGAPLATRCTTEVASEPVGLAASETKGEPERIVVTSGYGRRLSVLETTGLDRVFQVSLDRDPRAVLVDGNRAFVTHMTSSELSVVDLVGGSLSKVDVLTFHELARKAPQTRGDDDPPAPGVHGGQVFSLASADGRLFVPMVTVDPGEPRITGAYGSTEVPIKPFVGVVDLAATAPLTIGVPSQTESSHRACMLPRAAAATPSGRLFVTCAGIDELVELDGRADNAAQALRKRVRVPAGPLGIAADDTEVVVFAAFDREIAIVPLSGAGEVVRVGLSRRAGARDEAFERGRKIFHDSFDLRVSADGRACASCHPDGRDDGNTWSTPDGPRQTISLAGRIDGAGPYGWFGKHPTLDSHLKETMHRLGGRGFGDKKDQGDLAALESYLTHMKAPVATASSNDEQVKAGRALFHDPEQGCGACHADGGTDRAQHDVGSGKKDEAHLAFDTPSLAFVSASAPYFHDGRYATLDDVLAKGKDRMGHAAHLDAGERASLVAYMESLAPKAETPPREASFVAPKALEPLAPDAANAFEKGVLDASPPPLVLGSVDFDLARVPIVTISPPTTWDTKSDASQGEPLPSGELLWKNDCVAIPHHAASTLRLDWRETSMTEKLERCVYAPDPNGYFVWSEMKSTSIDPLADGKLHVVSREGFIRLGTKEVRIAREIVADAVAFDDGVLFAYRTKCDTCKEGERDTLHLLVPTEGDAIFGARTLDLEQGHAGHTEATLMPWYLAAWNRATGRHVETASRVGAPLAIVLRIDASRTASESEARVTIGRGTCRAGDFGSCP